MIGIDGFFLVSLHGFTIKFGIVALHAKQENAALVRAISLQVIAKIERLVMRLALLEARQRNFFLEALGEVIHTEGTNELRLVEIAFRLCDQVLQLCRQDATHVHPYTWQIAHQYGNFFLAAHGQQCALPENVELRRERRHLNNALHAFG